ncbi:MULTISPECIES: ATP-binding protein [unclassified Streptomyces]|uniref:ATP-binding protein n=1 Tax=unclassified Streptomyces TaxID=2593676 RepID=UPI002DDC8384|nr:ATP-binding protein [Streptomyces sp. NBC_01750]WSB02166.1 ATP-binding protein [Streptomyces sp. NBC_01794]WSD33578.1 ATP-binding protein [Streptomyces sp. NBC_01750]
MKVETTSATPEFNQRFSATRRGARLARHLAVHQLDGWGIPYGSDLSDSAAVIVAELTANAVTHARVPGRDFELRLALAPKTLRIEVSDARADRAPAPRPPTTDLETGRGLLLVDAVATTWGVADRVVGKTVWAELALR